MKYKHIVSGMLSAVLLSGGIQPILAANTTSGNTEITYTVGESYTWTAPATINFTSNSTDLLYSIRYTIVGDYMDVLKVFSHNVRRYRT